MVSWDQIVAAFLMLDHGMLTCASAADSCIALGRSGHHLVTHFRLETRMHSACSNTGTWHLSGSLLGAFLGECTS